MSGKNTPSIRKRQGRKSAARASCAQANSLKKRLCISKFFEITCVSDLCGGENCAQARRKLSIDFPRSIREYFSPLMCVDCLS